MRTPSSQYFPIALILWCISMTMQANNPHPNPHTGDLHYFEENKGQWESHIYYRAKMNEGRIFLEADKLTYLLTDPVDMEAVHDIKHDPQKSLSDHAINCHAFAIHFENGNTKAAKNAYCPSETYNNYFVGKDKNRWASHVKMHSEVSYTDLYKGIDFAMYSIGSTLKYDFIVAPKAKTNQIKLRYEGAERIFLKNGNLHIVTSVNTLIEQAPYAFQYKNGQEVAVPCRFKIRGKTVSFDFPKGYDKNEQLIIDPTLVFATYSGSTADNWGFTATFDDTGHFYAGGAAFDFGYPTTLGAFQTGFGGGAGSLGTDIAISKFSPNGSSLVYSTYIGGTRNEVPHSLIVNPQGNLVIYGTTESNNYPTTSGVFDPFFNGGTSLIISNIDYTNGSDIVVTILNGDGTDLAASTFIGGSGNDGLNVATGLRYNYGDEARGEVIVDEAGNVYVASITRSSNFPITAGAAQVVNGGGETDACVFKLSPDLSGLFFSTYLGGSNADAAYSLKIANNGSIYVCGGTRSFNFPVTSGALNTSQSGNTDGYIVQLSATGNSILNATYLGTNSYDQCFFVEIDAEQNVYTVGQTEGNYTVEPPGVYNNANSGQFVHKLDADLSTTIFSTIFGNGTQLPNIVPTAFLVDICDNVYVAGWGGEVNNLSSPIPTNTNGMDTTPDALQSTTDGSDFYFMVLSADAAFLEYGSYYGGSGSGEHVDGGTSRFDKEGVIYEAVCAGCGATDLFPTTGNAWSNTNNSNNCNFGAIKIEFDLFMKAVAVAVFGLTGCNPYTAEFQSSSTNTIDPDFFWDFGNGDTSTDANPTTLYDEAGTYLVTLIVSDDQTCNIADTATLMVTVQDPIQLIADFDAEKLDGCALDFAFFAAQPGLEYFWDFGDGNTGTGPNPTHLYDAPGTYDVTLIVDAYCAFPDTLTQPITLELPVQVAAELALLPESDCPPLTIFVEGAATAVTYFWDFGDGTTAEGLSATHTYETAGEYEILFTAVDSLTCNIADVVSTTATAFQFAIADFEQAPQVAEVGQEVAFTNLSQFADTYLWSFGDGNTDILEHPIHRYTEAGFYEVCLQAMNEEGCNDEICKSFEVIPPIMIGIPNAFSPNNDGENDVFIVEGRHRIAEIELKVFNRWGELVFESNDPEVGWDGYYKGVLQEMDAYVYWARIVYVSTREVFEKGNLTLLR